MRKPLKIQSGVSCGVWLLALLTGFGFAGLIWGQGGGDLGGRKELFPTLPSRVGESDGVLTIELVRPDGIEGELVFQLRVVDPIARSGVDFEPISTSITFGPDDMRRSLVVVILDNTSVDGDRSFGLEASLASPQSHPGFERARHTVWIEDNEQALVFDPSFGSAVSIPEPLLVFPDDTFLAAHSDGLFHWDADGRTGVVVGLEGFEETPRPNIRQGIQHVILSPEGHLVVGGSYESFGPDDSESYAWVRRYSREGVLLPGQTMLELPIGFARAMVLQSDDKVLYVGSLGTIQSGSVSTRMGRLLPDGSRDPSFQSDRIFAGSYGEVRTIGLQSSGAVLVGGSFPRFNRVQRGALVRLDSNGELDLAFDVSLRADSVVNAVHVDQDDRLIVSGDLVLADGSRHQLLRLTANGSVESGDPLNEAVIDGEVRSLLVDPERGWLYALGAFSQVNGRVRRGVARFGLETNEWDEAFVGIDVGSWALHERVYLQSTGQLLARRGRIFTDLLDRESATFAATRLDLSEGDSGGRLIVERLGSSDRSFVVQLAPDDALADGVVEPIPNQVRFGVGQTRVEVGLKPIDNGQVGPPTVFTLSLRSDDGGLLNSPGSVVVVQVDDNEVPNRMDHSFRTETGLSANVLLPLPDGRIAVGVGAGPSPLVMLRPDGTVDGSFRLQEPSSVVLSRTIVGMKRMDDSWLLAGGWLDPVAGRPRPWVGRIHLESGSFDPEFVDPILSHSRQGSGGISVLELQQKGTENRILAGGSIRFGQRFNGLIRLDGDGTVDESFAIGSGFWRRSGGIAVRTLEQLADGSLWVGGAFDAVNGEPFPALVRLTSEGEPFEGFRSPFQSQDEVYDSYLAADGSIWVAGRIDGVDSRVVRVFPNGSRDPSFSPVVADGPIHSFVGAGDRGVYLLGSFERLNGRAYEALGLLDPGGRLDLHWVANGGLGSGLDRAPLYQGFVDTEGRLVVSGGTGHFDGQDVRGLFRIFPDKDPSEPMIQFHADSLETILTEADDASVPLRLWRAGATDQATSYQIAVQGESATLGVDYVIDDLEGVFAPLSLEEEIRIRVVDDGLPEMTERMEFCLVDVSGDPVEAKAAVAIVDDEEPVIIEYPFSSRMGPNGDLNVVRALPDGRFLVGGTFDQYDEHRVNGVARVAADGAVDPGFEVAGGLTGSVHALAVQGDTIWAGGDFRYQFGDAHERENLIRMGPNGGADPRMVTLAEPSGRVLVIEPEPDGGVFLGGDFRRVGELSRDRFARLDSEGRVDETFGRGLSFSGTVLAIARQADGKVLVGGEFRQVGNESLGRLVRLNPDGTIDAGFATRFEGIVTSVRVLTDGAILVGGRYFRVDGQESPNVVKLLPDSSVDSGFVFPMDVWVNKLVDHEDEIVVIGNFITTPTSDRLSLISVSLGGELRRSWPSMIDGIVDGAVDLMGNPVVISRSRVYDGVPFTRLHRLRAGGFDQTTVNLIPTDTFLYEPDGNAVIRLRRFGDLSEATEIRVSGRGQGEVTEADFRLETDLVRFDPLENEALVKLLVRDDEEPEVDGVVAVEIESLTAGHVVGVSSLRIPIIDTDREGAVDLSFQPVLERLYPPPHLIRDPAFSEFVPATVSQIAVQEDQAIVIFGDFDRINGIAIPRLARLLPSGELDLEYRPEVRPMAVFQIGMQSGDRLVVHGLVGGTGPLVRLFPDGRLDPSFPPLGGVDGPGRFDGFHILPDDRIVVWGDFFALPPDQNRYLGLLEPDGDWDLSFGRQVGFNRPITHASLQAPRSLIVTGEFTRYGTESARGLARIGLDGRLDREFGAAASLVRNIATVHHLGDSGMQVVSAFRHPDTVPNPLFATLSRDGEQVAVADTWPKLESSLPLADAGSYVAGDGTIRGMRLRGLARTTPDGVLDPEFDVGVGLDGKVEALAVMGNGDLLVGGMLNSFNGIPVDSLIRIHGRPVLEIQEIRFTGDGHVEIAVSSVPGRTYQMETSIDLGTWRVSDTRVAERNRVLLFDEVDGDVGFYRVRALD